MLLNYSTESQTFLGLNVRGYIINVSKIQTRPHKKDNARTVSHSDVSLPLIIRFRLSLATVVYQFVMVVLMAWFY